MAISNAVRLDSLQNPVPEHGYRWITEDELDRPSAYPERSPWNMRSTAGDAPLWLTFEVGHGIDMTEDPRKWWNKVDRFQPTFPLRDQPALFLDFANLNPTPESILEFANKYGNVFKNQQPIAFAEWEYSILTLKFWTDAWFGLRSRKLQGLVAQFFKAQGNGDVLLQHAGTTLDCPIQTARSISDDTGAGVPLDVLVEIEGDKSNVWKSSEDGTTSVWSGGREISDQDDRLLAACRSALQVAINNRLALASFDISLDTSEIKKKPEWLFFIKPRSLFSGIWTQFADAVARKADFYACFTCHKWFERLPGLHRTTRLYCSDACRAKAARFRQGLNTAVAKSVTDALTSMGYIVEQHVIQGTDRIEFRANKLVVAVMTSVAFLDSIPCVKIHIYYDGQGRIEREMAYGENGHQELKNLVRKIVLEKRRKSK